MVLAGDGENNRAGGEAIQKTCLDIFIVKVGGGFQSAKVWMGSIRKYFETKLKFQHRSVCPHANAWRFFAMNRDR